MGRAGGARGRARSAAASEATAALAARRPPRGSRAVALDETAALANEFRLGRATIESGETLEGAARFRDGAGRHGRFE